MITINLAPLDELEDPLWFMPDLIMLLAALILSFTAVSYYLGMTEDEINHLVAEQNRYRENMIKLKPQLQEHRELTAKIEKLTSRQQSLAKITESKVERYKPIIILEHIQNLKPDPIWLMGVEFGSFDIDAVKGINRSGPPAPVFGAGGEAGLGPTYNLMIRGRGFDNEVVAEFVSSLKATANQEIEPTDLRTQVFFEKVDIHLTEKLADTSANLGTGFKYVLGFQLFIKFSVRTLNDQPVNAVISQAIDQNSKRAL